MRSVVLLVLVCSGTVLIEAEGDLRGPTVFGGVIEKCNGTLLGCTEDGNRTITEPSIRTSNHSDVTIMTSARRHSRRNRVSKIAYRNLKHALQKTMLHDAFDEYGLDALRYQVQLKGLEQRLFLHKGGKVIVALILLKLKIITVGILLVLLGIKKFIVIVALLGPLIKKFRFSGHYVTDINYPPLPIEADEEEHVHHYSPHDHGTKHPWGPPPYNPHQGHAKHFGDVNNNELAYSAHVHKKQHGDAHGPAFSAYDYMKQHGDSHGPPVGLPNYMKQHGAGDGPRPPFNPYDYMKQNGDSHGPPFVPPHYMKRYAADDNHEFPNNLQDSSKQNGAGDELRSVHKPNDSSKQNGDGEYLGPVYNPNHSPKQNGAGEYVGPVYNPNHSLIQNGAGENVGPVYKPNDSSKQNEIVDSNYGMLFAGGQTDNSYIHQPPEYSSKKSSETGPAKRIDIPRYWRCRVC